jgi:hypothetical protein
MMIINVTTWHLANVLLWCDWSHIGASTIQNKQTALQVWAQSIGFYSI